MGEVVTQSVSFEKWTLATPDDMFACLRELVDAGFKGHVASQPAALPATADEGVWDLEINRDDPDTRVTGVRLGMVVVLMGGALDAMTSDQFATRFGGQ